MPVIVCQLGLNKTDRESEGLLLRIPKSQEKTMRRKESGRKPGAPGGVETRGR